MCANPSAPPPSRTNPILGRSAAAHGVELAKQKRDNGHEEAHRSNLSDEASIASLYWLHAASPRYGNTGLPGSGGNCSGTRTDCKRDAVRA